MRKLTTVLGLIMLFVLGVPAFAQTGQAATQAKKQETAAKGMVWYYLDTLKKDADKLEKQILERDRLVVALDKEVKEGDKNLVRLYLRRLVSSTSDVLAGCDHVDRDLTDFDRAASNALENKIGELGSLDGFISESDYREALKVVRCAKDLLKFRSLSASQVKVWDAALKIPGLDPQYFKIQDHK